MSPKEIADATIALDAWFKYQDIEDKYAAIVVAEFMAYSMARNFDAEGLVHMTKNFQALVENVTNKYLEEARANEAKRPH